MVTNTAYRHHDDFMRLVNTYSKQVYEAVLVSDTLRSLSYSILQGIK